VDDVDDVDALLFSKWCATDVAIRTRDTTLDVQAQKGFYPALPTNKRSCASNVRATTIALLPPTPARLTVVFLLLLLLLALSTNAVPDGVSAFRLLLLLLALLENVRSHWEQGLARAGVKSGCR